MGLVYLGRRDARSAVALFKRATEPDPKHAEAQLRLAAFLTGSSDKQVLENIQERVQGALAASPDNPAALDILAVAELRLGKIEDALAHLEKAFAKAPKNLPAAVILSNAKVGQRDLPAAEAVLKKLVEGSP